MKIGGERGIEGGRKTNREEERVWSREKEEKRGANE